MKAGILLLAVALLGANLPAHSQKPAPQPQQDKYGGLGFFIHGMRLAEGSLGVEPAVLPGKRLAVFMWFRDATSANTFIGGSMCQALRTIAKAPDSVLPTMPEIKGPVMVIASFTSSTKPDAPMMVDQIAVERMVPLTGGFAYGGRFAPKGVEVPNLSLQSQMPEVAGLDSSTLVTTLKKTQGCIQVNTMQSDSGKQVTVAWFANKKAATDWYNSAPFSKVAGASLSEIPDNTTPVAVFISLTPAKTTDPNLKTPVSQLAVEFYTTLNGGFSRGGRFRPSMPLKL